MKIGIFDSGIGGITVLHEAYHRLPNENYIFYADVDHVPYGMKKPEEIIRYADNIVSELYEKGVDAVLIACNTATSVAAEHLRAKYSIPIIGMEPAVKPAVEAAVNAEGRVLVMATPVTIRENKLRKLLEQVDRSHIVDLLPMPRFVLFAENGVFDGEEVDAYIEERLAEYNKESFSEIVLGCTHFNYFKPAIKKAFSGLSEEYILPNLIDGNLGTIRHLADVLGLEVVSDEDDEPLGENGIGDRFNEIDNRTTYLMSGRAIGIDEYQKIKHLHERLELVRNID